MNVPRWPGKTLVPAMDGLLAHLEGREAGHSVDAVPEYKICNARAFDAGFVAESISLTLPDLEALVASGVPAVVRNLDGAVFALVGGARARAKVLGPDDGVSELAAADVARAIAGGGKSEAARLVQKLGGTLSPRKAKKLEAALDEEVSRGRIVAAGIALRAHHGESTKQTLASIRLPKHMAKLFGASLVQSLLGTGAWAVIGALALHGHADSGSLLGWALLSLTASLVQVITTQYVGKFTLRASTRLRMRLLEGALSLEGDELSSYGMGGLMVISTQADQFLTSVIALLLSSLATLTNVIATLVILSTAPLPNVTIGIFAASFVLPFVLLPKLLRMYVDQQAERVRLTTEMVERMLGHRTRLVQQTPKSWHQGEDESLSSYAERAQGFDRWTVHLRLLPRAYFLLSLSAVFFVLVASPTEQALALVLGGISLGSATLTGLTETVLGSGDLYAQWKSIAPVVREAKRKRRRASRALASADPKELLEMRSVEFAYPKRRPVFEEANVVIRKGDKVLVEGPSGGGKTTMASLLAGMRRPSGGLVLVKGVDHHAIGESDLRRVVASAPQFYKNHVFSGPFVLNLLLGRSWPPGPNDLREATEVCHDLGLGPLLDKMPGGMFQFVGEMGWQLSHGEKSRLYLARTILQGSDVVVLDETFGALDPATLRQCLDATMKRCPTMVVITHR